VGEAGVTYRDDRDADRARIEALEAELALSQRKVAELEGRNAQALVLASSDALAPVGPPTAAQRWLGASLRLQLTRRFDGAYPTDRFEELIFRIREVTRDPGRSELLRSSLTWSATAAERSTGPFTVVTVSIKDGATTLVVGDRLNQLAGATFGGVGGGAFGGSVMLPILLGAHTVPVLAPVLAIGWLATGFLATRKLFRWGARRRAAKLQLLFDALVREIDDAIERPGV
jgi:hypothetical protein